VGDDFLCDDLVVVRMFEPFAAGLPAQLRLRQRELDRHLQIFFDIARRIEGRIFVTWRLAHAASESPSLIQRAAHLPFRHIVLPKPKNRESV
jgi:hypothetical protein